MGQYPIEINGSISHYRFFYFFEMLPDKPGFYLEGIG